MSNTQKNDLAEWLYAWFSRDKFEYCDRLHDDDLSVVILDGRFDFEKLSSDLLERLAIAAIRTENQTDSAMPLPGLDELRAAADDDSRFPRNPNRVSYADVAARYPVAAAYLTAESYEHSGHYVKSGAGRRAKDRIAAGENYEQVLREMESEWLSYASSTPGVIEALKNELQTNMESRHNS